MFYRAFVCPQLHVKTTDEISMNILSQNASLDNKELITFGSHSRI